MSCMLRIDHNFNQTERFLSKCAAVPLFGILPGVIKVVIGGVQLITSLALGIFTLPLRCTKHRGLNNYCWTHVKHGFGNVVAGFLEAIPFVGLGIHLVRKARATSDMSDEVEEGDYNGVLIFIRTNHEDKFMRYQSLSKRDKIWLNVNLGPGPSTWKRAYPPNNAWESVNQLPRSLKPAY